MLSLPTSDDALPPPAKPGDGDCFRTHSLRLPTPWRTEPATTLHLLYRRSSSGLSAVVTDAPLAANPENYAEQGARSIDLGAPVELTPTAIAKPWGQELWYSGIEARGESAVRIGDQTLPLSHYLAMAPERLCRRAQPLLLKVLDPAPDPVLGDLYFETHDQKHEVYVVTDVDKAVWPDGVGAIRFGMNQTKRAVYSTDADFRAAYLEAVQAYERLRREIDNETSPISTETEQRERQLRTNMEAFTQLHPLRVGDVVQVPPGIPHALQHGVRVFEFQTPVYERNIISFNQRVLTQDGWDSARAIEQMQIDAAHLSTPANVDIPTTESTCRCQRIADFADFEVQRIELRNGSHWHAGMSLPPTTPYLMIAIVDGNVELRSASGQLAIGQSQAAFVPASATQLSAHNSSSQNSTLLVAAPKPHTAGSITNPVTMNRK